MGGPDAFELLWEIERDATDCRGGRVEVIICGE